jgi:hypothetical protein
MFIIYPPGLNENEWLSMLETSDDYREILKQYRGTTAIFQTSAMNIAAKRGHLQIVKWLFKNNIDLSTNAVNFAATYGHLNIVRFLHENISDNECDFTMDYASARGH